MKLMRDCEIMINKVTIDGSVLADVVPRVLEVFKTEKCSICGIKVTPNNFGCAKKDLGICCTSIFCMIEYAEKLVGQERKNV